MVRIVHRSFFYNTYLKVCDPNSMEENFSFKEVGKLKNQVWGPKLEFWASLGDWGRHSGQETTFKGFPKVLGSWWEIFENGGRGSTQNFAADAVSIVVWPGESFLENYTKSRNAHFSKIDMSKFSRNRIFFRGQKPRRVQPDINELLRIQRGGLDNLPPQNKVIFMIKWKNDFSPQFAFW